MYGDEQEGCQTLPIVIGVKYSKVFVTLVTAFIIASVWGIYFYIERLQQTIITPIYFAVLITTPLLIIV